MPGTLFRTFIAVLFLGLLTAPVAWADDDDDDDGSVVVQDSDDDDDDDDDEDEFSEDLRHAVTLRSIRRHQRAFQRIADRNNGIRSSGTEGYNESVDYVVRRLRRAGYDVTRQVLQVSFFEELSNPTFTLLMEDPNDLTDDETVEPPNNASSYFTATFSGDGIAEGKIEVVDVQFDPSTDPNTSTSGCEAADFDGFTAGNIALVSRGTCFFQTKAQNAQDANAAGLIIFNEGQENRTGAFASNLGVPFNIPVFFASTAVGQLLLDMDAAPGGTYVRMETDVFSELRPNENVIADTYNGNPEQTIVVGAHLDSVPQGPGIQDNGSGSAAILEIALQLARWDRAGDDDDDDGDDTPIRNRVRFAWWSAEELGLVGSQFYVDNLTAEEQADIALNLNFDMIGSPNFVRFVYDGNGDATPDENGNPQPGPEGSAHIEQMYRNYFVEQGLPIEPTAFDGRSDYGPFIADGVEIPAGGLFTGAEVLKTQALADVYGGTVDAQFDPCYHLACDTFDNISLEALDQMSDAAAHSVAFYAGRDDLFGPQPALVPVSVTGGLTSGALAHDHEDMRR